MLVETLIKAEWANVVNWGNMRASSSTSYGTSAYTESDFDNFVEITFRSVAEELGIKYELIKDILYGRNKDFFEEKVACFADCDDIAYDSDEYEELTSSLLIPCVHHIKKVNRVDTFFEYFENMCLSDKIEVLERLLKTQIDIPCSSQDVLLSQFEQLDLVQKCEVIKKFFNAKVGIDN